jgi:ElaB/YqjD/DUF883 family membrane-anchored ribosome-binding protein
MPSPNTPHPATNATHEPHKTNRNARTEQESLAEQVESIRSEVQALTATLGKVAAKQWTDVQSTAQDTVRRNPIAAVAIAAGLGFLYGAIRR